MENLNLNDYYIEAINNILAATEDLKNPFGAKYEGIKFYGHVYMVTLDSTNTEWIVPTGTKDLPDGISNTECNLLVLLDALGMVYKITTVEAFRQWIKENVSKLTREIDEEYKTMCFRIPTKLITNEVK